MTEKFDTNIYFLHFIKCCTCFHPFRSIFFGYNFCNNILQVILYFLGYNLLLEVLIRSPFIQYYEYTKIISPGDSFSPFWFR